MEPKFQSTFIPRGPVAETSPLSLGSKVRRKSLISFVAILLFVISGLSAIGVFSYRIYLDYRIRQMGQDLEDARTALAPQTVIELINLNNRITSVEELIKKHQVLSPLFIFLEENTPVSVRYTEFNYSVTTKGIDLVLKGEARGYADLAAASSIFNKSQYFKSPVFSDLTLNERGNVVFSMKTFVDTSLISYENLVVKTRGASSKLLIPTSTTTSQISTSTQRNISTSTRSVGTSTLPRI